MSPAELSMVLTGATARSTASLVGGRTLAVAPMKPALMTRCEVREPSRRTKIWEFNSNLHCSIIGTCLSTGELRQVLKKLGLTPPDSSDHDLHGTAVTVAGRHDGAAKLLNKALDTCHKLPISQFAKATSEAQLRILWREAVRRGDIPGAYWAALTHPAATPAIVREAFGEVHMLSHLVGAANRADIRRLCQLEADKTGLETRLERQQLAFREAVVSRNADIRALHQALAQSIAAEPVQTGTEDGNILRSLVADLECRLAKEAQRRCASEEKLAAAQAAAIEERTARIQAERDGDLLRQELDAVGKSLAPKEAGAYAETRLDGMVLLYVGGRANQAAHLRAASEAMGATFLHHDGGVENHPSLLPGLTSRADLVLFPVDCISHDAALSVKSLCRQGAKRFIPLRSASISLLAALRRPEVVMLADAAD
jgi:hypothetical protein